LSHPFKAIVLGIFIGIIGLVIALIPFGLALEEDAGLTILFKMRGARKNPSDVIVISLDKQTADRMNLPPDIDEWPRSIYSKLIETLVRNKATVIAVDIFFGKSRSSKDDKSFADAIREARNVVLVESLVREKKPLTDQKGIIAGDVTIEKRVPPIRPLASSSVALAPFPLPKVPVKISQYWTFKTAAGDTPTLPVIAFQIYSLEVYEDFIRLFETVAPSQRFHFSKTRDEIIKNRDVVALVKFLRSIFAADHTIGKNMLEELKASKSLSLNDRKKKIITSLIKMYQSADSQYLNFYGPPRSITTISYSQLLQPEGITIDESKKMDFGNKAVFIGSLGAEQSAQKDGFYTVFSQPDGMDISGVEIAATAFANLLEDTPVRPLRFSLFLLTLFLWGMAIGIFCRILPPLISLIFTVGAGVLYLAVILYLFKNAGTWCPLIIPLFMQAPIALFSSLAWKYFDTSKERSKIRTAFGYYLPDNVIDKLLDNISYVKTSSQHVYGTCLNTDAKHYTTLAESMEANAFQNFINRYYEVIFEPVKKHNGVVSNVVGDSMLAMWVTTNPHDDSRKDACRAALEIQRAVARFNQLSGDLQLPTRVGLHSGNFLLSNIGAIDHYEYRPVGDIVNTATRIEGLNKSLGTWVLVSDEVLKGIEGFLARYLGSFLLAGKSKPLGIHELICPKEEAGQRDKDLCEDFAAAFDAFKRQSLAEAIEKFSEIIERHREDGPSHFYMTLCRKYGDKETSEPWDGVIRIDTK
jgi:adenylate cyclase